METAEAIEVKERIAKEALDLFFQRGIKSVSVDDIAQHLSMSKKTIYKWFTNKDEVVYEGVKHYMSSVHRDCDHVAAHSKDAIEELINIMSMMRKIFSNFHPAVFHDLQKYHSSSWKLWLEHKTGYMLEHIKANLRRGIEEGLFRADLDVEIIARLRLVQLEVPFNTSVFPAHEFVLQRVQMACVEHYMLGVATLKGHKLINEYNHITEEE
ncbi:TetR/AcrR family transcriptional regulator [Pontibacter harenae]|uniref:TetR/AcrR family transcriptional regulator n=1 Tax=Pontibacter harenae TaxID=2894083 RepID=UPI001E406F86|nr:TetR/AcrR family transcriptional regulator [Pontibacter harenae]MCC9166452.1 TetR/AcrR family transcriptional regulator [Pontibacter harenae]